jgi:hypothetical protein
MKKQLMFVACGMLLGACASDPCLDGEDCVDNTSQASLVSNVASSRVTDFVIEGNKLVYAEREAASCSVAADRARILEVSKSGINPTPTVIYTVASCGAERPQEVVANATKAYYIDTLNGTVIQVVRSGGATTTLFSGLTFSTTAHQHRLALDTSANQLFVADNSVIKKYDFASSTPSTLFTFPMGRAPAKMLAFDANYIYYPSGSKIYKVDRSTGVETVWLTSSNSAIDAINKKGATDLDWLESSQFEVHTMALTSGTDTTLYDSNASTRLGTSVLTNCSGKTFEIDYDSAMGNDFNIYKIASGVRSEVLSSDDMTDGDALASDNVTVFIRTQNGIVKETCSNL